jgi:hypothetical protein
MKWAYLFFVLCMSTIAVGCKNGAKPSFDPFLGRTTVPPPGTVGAPPPGTLNPYGATTPSPPPFQPPYGSQFAPAGTNQQYIPQGSEYAPPVGNFPGHQSSVTPPQIPGAAPVMQAQANSWKVSGASNYGQVPQVDPATGLSSASGQAIPANYASQIRIVQPTAGTAPTSQYGQYGTPAAQPGGTPGTDIMSLPPSGSN